MIVAVGEDDVEPRPLDRTPEDRQGEAADPDRPHLPLVPRLLERGDRLGEDRAEFAELDVVDEDHVDDVGPEPDQALFEARAHPLGPEVEVGLAVTTDLRGQDDAIADPQEGLAQDRLGPGLARSTGRRRNR